MNDADLAMWNSIPPEKPENLKAYYTSVTRNTALKKYHSNTAQKRNSIYDTALDELEDCLASKDDPASELEAKELEKAINRFLKKLALIAQERERVEHTVIAPSEEAAEEFIKYGTAPLVTGCRLSELIKRPQLDYEKLTLVDKTRPELPEEVFEQVETELKYEGYVKKQLAEIKKHLVKTNRKIV